MIEIAQTQSDSGKDVSSKQSLASFLTQSSYSLVYKTSRDPGCIAAASSNPRDDHNPISFDANEVFDFLPLTCPPFHTGLWISGECHDFSP